MSLSFYQEKGQFEATDRGAPRKGYKDVTIIQSLDMYGEDEEIKLTEDYLPSRKKTDEKTLQAYDGEALLIRRIVQKYNDREVLTRSELRIQSETLCAAFREIVMYTYDSLDIGTTPIIIPSPFFELFFKRKEIAAYLDNEDKDQSLRAEVRLLHNFIQEDKVTVSKLDEYNSLLRQKTVSYNNLWTLFPPNELLILNNDAAPECWLCRNVVAVPKKVEWLVTGVRLDFDGHNIGLIRQTCSISFRDRLNGTMEISQLPIVPVRYFDGWDIMRAKLIERGRRYQQFMGTNLDSHAYLHYKGPLWESDDLSAKAKSKVNILCGQYPSEIRNCN